MNNVVLITHDSGEKSRFTLVPGSEGYVYAQGRSCTADLAKNSDGNTCLLKKFREGVQPKKIRKDRDVNKRIVEIHQENKRDYIPCQEFMGTDESGARYQVFKLHVQASLEELVPLCNMKSKSEDALCEGIRSLLTTFKGLLSHVDLIHRAGYLHCDITLSNVLIFRPNDQPIIQLIDWDSALEVKDLLSWNKAQIRDYLLIRSSPTMRISGQTYEVYTVDDIESFAALDFKKNKNLAVVMDTTALSKLLCFLLFGNTTFTAHAKNTLIRFYENNFGESYDLLAQFFSKAFAARPEARYTSCKTMREKIDEIIKALPLPKINYLNAHAELREELRRNHPGCPIEALLNEITFEILPHIQYGETEFVQKQGSSPLEQLMALPHTKALFLYGEGGGGKTCSAKHYLYSTLCQMPENRLVLYYSLTQKGLGDIRRYLNSPLRAELQTDKANKPIVLLDALDESAIVTGTDPEIYQDFYELIQQYRDRYTFVVTSRTLPPEKISEEKSSFSDVFTQGQFKELDDEQLRGFLSKVRQSLEEIEQATSRELIETLRLPMMLNLFVQIIDGANEEKKATALCIQNEVELIKLYLQKLYKENPATPYYNAEYHKGEPSNELYANEEYTEKTFAEQCMAIAKATFLRQTVELHPRTIRIFRSIVTPVDDKTLEARCKEFAQTLYEEKFKLYAEKAQQQYLDDIDKANFVFEDHTRQKVFEMIRTSLRNYVNEKTSSLSSTKSLLRFKYKDKHSQEIQAAINNAVTVRLLEPFVMHKVFRDYFCTLALSNLLEGLFANLQYDHKLDRRRVKRDTCSTETRYEEDVWEYAYFDSQDYRTIREFVQALKPFLPLSKNEWKFTGLLLGLNDGEYTKAKQRVDQFRYLYVCYFGHLSTSSTEFSVMNDIYHMICMTYRFFDLDPFAPSVSKPNEIVIQFSFLLPQAERKAWLIENPFKVRTAYGSRYATTYTIPNEVYQIDSFDYCPDMSEVIFGEDIDYVDPRAFAKCPALQRIDVSKNSHFICKNGIVFSTDNGYPVWPRPLPDHVTVPEEIHEITHPWIYGEGSPYKNTTKLVFEEGVEAITDDNIFENCPKLVHVEFPQSLQSLSEMISFRNCPNLKYLTVHKSFFAVLLDTMVNKGFLDVFSPSLTKLFFVGTQQEWANTVKPSNFFTELCPNLEEVVCVKDGVTLRCKSEKP